MTNTSFSLDTSHQSNINEQNENSIENSIDSSDILYQNNNENQLNNIISIQNSIRKITQNLNSDLSIQSSSVLALQEASEAYLTSIDELSNLEFLKKNQSQINKSDDNNEESENKLFNVEKLDYKVNSNNLINENQIQMNNVSTENISNDFNDITTNELNDTYSEGSVHGSFQDLSEDIDSTIDHDDFSIKEQNEEYDGNIIVEGDSIIQREREDGEYLEISLKQKQFLLSDLPSHPLLLIFSFLTPLESQAFPMCSSIYSSISNPVYFDSDSFLIEKSKYDREKQKIGMLPFYLSGNAFNDPISDIPAAKTSVLPQDLSQKKLDGTIKPKRIIIGNDITFRTHLVRYWEYIWYFRSIYKKPLRLTDSFRDHDLRKIFLGESELVPFSLISTFIKDDILGFHFRKRKNDSTYDYMISTLNFESILNLHHEERRKGEVFQWVKNVSKVSSQAPSNLARNIIGYPRTYPKYGTAFRSAWCASRTGKDEYLELEFEYPVYITEVQIYETFDTGSVTLISCWDSTSKSWVHLWSLKESGKTSRAPQSQIFSPKLNECQVKSNKIRLEISNENGKCLYIDAVRLKGRRRIEDNISTKKNSDVTNIDFEQEIVENNNSSSLTEQISNFVLETKVPEDFYKPLEDQIRRSVYTHQMPSHIHVSGSLMTYIRTDIKGEQFLSITKTTKEKKHVERPMYIWDFCVATRIRNDNKVLCILKRFKDKITYSISLWDLVQDREVLNYPITESKNNIDFFELDDHMIVFARKTVVHLYDSSRKQITPQTYIENWKHVRGFAHDSRVISISLNSDVGLASDMMAVGCIDGSIHLWSLRRGKCLHLIKGFGKSISKVQLIAAGTLLAATYINDSRLFIYDCFTGCLYRQPIALFDRVGWNPLKFTIDGKNIIANPQSENRAVIYRFDDSDEDNAAKFIRLGHKTTQDQSSCTIL